MSYRRNQSGPAFSQEPWARRSRAAGKGERGKGGRFDDTTARRCRAEAEHSGRLESANDFVSRHSGEHVAEARSQAVMKAKDNKDEEKATEMPVMSERMEERGWTRR